MFQKIAYFATELGLPTNLEYSKASFGPFASGVKPMQARLMANGLIRETPLGHGRMYAVDVGPAYEKVVDAYSAELKGWDEIINRVADLFLRFDVTQAEIAATVHFAATRLVRVPKGERPSELQVLNAVKAWKIRRKPPLSDEAVARMIRNLNLLGWVDLKASDELPIPESVFVDEFDVVEA
jgi:hypothetical protein